MQFLRRIVLLLVAGIISQPALAQSGRGSVAGTVRNDRKQPVAGAVVSISETDAIARTDSSGRFTINDILPGSHVITARAVGHSPVNYPVVVVAEKSATVDFVLPVLNTLTTRYVTDRTALRAEYEDRRERKVGIFVDSARLTRPDFVSAFMNLPLVRVTTGKFGAKVTLRNLSSRAGCTPEAFLDGTPTILDALTARLPSDFRAVEFLTAEQAPAKYQMDVKCGVVLFWSKNFRW